MRVIVGPVPSGSTMIWVAYARTVLGQAMAGRSPARVDPDIVEGFESFLDGWERLAAASPEFTWTIDLDPDQARFLTHAFFQLVSGLDREASQRGYPISPPEGEAFYFALVGSLLDALINEGDELAAFAIDLRDQWPGWKDG